MKIKPLGFYVLVEMIEVEQVTSGGIVLPGDLVNKEQEATDVGYVRAIGPTAYVGYPGCDVDTTDIDGATEINLNTPAEKWGLEVGMKIEYRKFEGKPSAMPGYDNFRYIPDSHIIGAVE
jgi:hypothetical protein